MNHPLSIDKILWSERGKGIASAGRIPEKAGFFQDHFPDFPILPGVMALELLRMTVDHYFREVEPLGAGSYRLKNVRSVRFSNYLRPGDEWEGRMDLIEKEGSSTHWRGEIKCGGQTAVTARFVFEIEQAEEIISSNSK